MKKTQILVGTLLLALLLGIGIYIFWNSKDTKPLSQTSLAEIQEPSSTQSGAASLSRALSLEKQIQLEQISEIYEVQESSHLTLIIESFQKYKADFSLIDAQKVHEVLQTHPSQDSLKSQLQALTGISLLKNDLEKLQNSYKNLQEEKQLEQERLELFAEAQEREVRSANEQLLEMILRNSIETFGASGSLTHTDVLIKNIQENLLKPQNIFDTEVFNTHVKQKTFLKTQLEKHIFGTTLSSEQKEELQETILKNILEWEILLPTPPQTGYFWKIPGFASMQIWDFFIPHQSYASETDDITPAERVILVLKTQVQINKLLQKSIDTEIALNNGSISAVEYDSIINQNLIAIEELLIFQESLENDSTLLSLDTIQNFQLWSYVDDSQQIINLNPIAYIASKRGHAMVQNLNGSVKLAQENMMLYPGYAIETLAGAEVTLEFIDESLLRLEALSKVSLKSGTENIAIEVNTWSIWARVLKPLLSGEVLSIDTGDVSLAVAGTSLYVSASGSTKQIFVVDSYFPEWSGSVIATQKSNGQEQSVSNRKKIELPANGNLQVRNQNKASLLQAKTQLWDYIAEDLSYISLTLDDRKRGFYNSPLGAKNNGQNFIGKLEGELNASLPGVAERGYILKNTELAGQSMSTWSIYHLIKKDSLITDIKNSSNTLTQKSQKISAVIDINLQNIQTELGNQRALETLFDYNIAQDILDASSMNTQDLENLFLNFDIQTRENDAKILEAAKNKLTVSSLVSRDITLSWSIQQSGRTISIDWSSSSDILSSTGVVQNATLTRNRNVILTATLTLWKLSTSKDFAVIVTPRQLTDEEKLDKSGEILTTFIQDIAQSKFLNSLTYAETQNKILSFSWSIEPIITWSGSMYVNRDGTTNRPDFSINTDILNLYISTQVQAILTHPTNPSISLTKGYTVQIKKKNETPQEKIDRIANTAWNTILAGKTYSSGNDTYFSQNTLTFPLTMTPASLSYKVTGNATLSWNTLSLQQSANTGSLTLTPLLTLIEGWITYTGALNPSSKTIKVRPSHEAIANQTLSGAKLAIENYFNVSGNRIISKEKNGANMKSLLPDIDSEIGLQWNNFTPYMNSGGTIQSPSFSTWDKSKTGSLKLSLAGATIGPLEIKNLNLTFRKLDETAPEKIARIQETGSGAFWQKIFVWKTNSNNQLIGNSSTLTGSFNIANQETGMYKTGAIMSYDVRINTIPTNGSLSYSGAIKKLIYEWGTSTGKVSITPVFRIWNHTGSLSVKQFIVPISQDAVNKKKVDDALADLEDFFGTSPKVIPLWKNAINQISWYPSHPWVTITWNKTAGPNSLLTSSTGSITHPAFSAYSENPSITVNGLLRAGTQTGSITWKKLTIARLAETPKEKADRLIAKAKEDFENHYNTRKNIENSLNHPTVWWEINITWLDGGSELSSSWVITRPSYNGNDISKTIRAKFTHPDASASKTAEWLLVKFVKDPCDNSETDKIVSNVCYKLVAKAEYATPWDIDLKTPDGVVIPRPLSAGINLNTCDTTWNCAWTSKAIIASMYWYDASKILDNFNRLKSWMSYDWSAWIVIDNDNTAGQDYLPYDLSSLNLWTDWAIEMSVRGEDLNRWTNNYTLLNIPTVIKIFSNPTYWFWILEKSTNYNFIWKINTNWYKKILVTRKNNLFTLNANWLSTTLNVTNSSNSIYIGWHNSWVDQWNWIINFFKIYKKQ